MLTKILRLYENKKLDSTKVDIVMGLDYSYKI